MLKVFLVISMFGQNTFAMNVPAPEDNAYEVCFKLAAFQNADIDNAFADPIKSKNMIFKGIVMKRKDVVVSCHLTDARPFLENPVKLN